MYQSPACIVHGCGFLSSKGLHGLSQHGLIAHKLQEVLLKLEADIAALPTGQEGYTAPGKFIFELLAKVNLTEQTFGFMLQLLDAAMSLLSDEALAAGRRWGLAVHCTGSLMSVWECVCNSGAHRLPHIPSEGI